MVGAFLYVYVRFSLFKLRSGGILVQTTRWRKDDPLDGGNRASITGC